MFIDEIKKISKENRKQYPLEKYVDKIKRKMMKEAKKGYDFCRIWLPYGLDLDELNEVLVEDGIECLFLHSNIGNTKYKVYVSEKIDSEELMRRIEIKRER